MLIHRSSLSRVASTWLVLTLASAAAAPADAQEDSVSGKNVVAMDGEFDPPLDCDQDILIGTLAKGLRGAVLTVHVTASEIEEGTVPRGERNHSARADFDRRPRCLRVRQRRGPFQLTAVAQQTKN